MSQSEPRKPSLKEIAERSAKTLASKSVTTPISGSSTDIAGTLAALAARASSTVAAPPSGPAAIPPARPSPFDDAPPRSMARSAANPFAASTFGAEARVERTPITYLPPEGPESLPPMSRRTLPPQVMTQPPPPEPSSARSRWMPLAGGALVVALSAASFAFVSRRGTSADADGAPVLNSNASPPPGAAVRNIDSQQAAPEPVVMAKAEEPLGDVGTQATQPPSAPVAPIAHAGKAAEPKSREDKKAVVAEAPVAAAPVVATPEPTPSPAAAPAGGAVGELGDEIRKRVGAKEKGDDAKAEASPQVGNGASQEKPSAGAVQGALNGVRGAAKACLDGQEVVTRVGIVFGSSGAVSSVAISGGAAGSTAEGCVRAAVMKAKVEPFTAPTFSTSLTLRP